MEELSFLYFDDLINFKKQSIKIKRLWNISDITAKILYNVVIIKEPKNILELGTSNGYSAFWLATAGRITKSFIHTVEIDSERYSLAKNNLQYFDNVKIYNKDILNFIQESELNFQMVFIDANKSDYYNYMLSLENIMSDECIIVADNCESHKDTVRNFIEYTSKSPQYKSLFLKVESGLNILMFKKKLLNTNLNRSVVSSIIQ